MKADKKLFYLRETAIKVTVLEATCAALYLTPQPPI